MPRSNRDAILMALAAATLFGAVVPASRMLLSGIGPVTLAGLLYLGAGICGSVLRTMQVSGTKHAESPVRVSDLPWLFGLIITGSIIGPILCMVGLTTTPAATASLLLNAELAFTALIAVLAFHEHIGKRGIVAIIAVIAGGLLLSYDPSGTFGFSTGALLIILACLCWGLDNNFTRIISGKEPAMIVMVKGLVAGVFSISLGYAIGEPFPSGTGIPAALIIGCLGYGLSIFLVIRSFRVLGSSRTGALFATAPFIGLFLSILILGESAGTGIWLSLPLMALGAWLIATEHHGHTHIHLPVRHEHRHRHDDDHHQHHHDKDQEQNDHAHFHVHEQIEHDHAHTPDIHHYHDHQESENTQDHS